MDEASVNQLLNLLESQLAQANDTMAQLRQQVTELSHENNRLRMTNAHLESVVTEPSEPLVTEALVASSSAEESVPQQAPRAPQAGKARLQTFYQEGIHVCHPYFGMKRGLEEECMFCLNLLDGLQAESR